VGNGGEQGATRSPFFVDLTRSVIDVIGVSQEQEAALNNHVPRAVIGIVILCTLIGAFLLGLTFGRAKWSNGVLATMYSLLFSATVFTIDLDHPQGGFIAVDIAPLRSLLRDMTNAPSARLIRAPIP
jgi:ABC-type transport system involved in cytochrome c biogenesis permease subunit